MPKALPAPAPKAAEQASAPTVQPIWFLEHADGPAVEILAAAEVAHAHVHPPPHARADGAAQGLKDEELLGHRS